MSTLQEIKAALPKLTAAERAELERCLRDGSRPHEAPVPLPDYAARRRAIYGDRILPNMVLQERDSLTA